MRTLAIVAVASLGPAAASAAAANTYIAPPASADSAPAACTPSGGASFSCPNLRSAVAAAEASSGATVQLSAGTYTLSGGALAIGPSGGSTSVSITGAGSSKTTIQETQAGAGVIAISGGTGFAIKISGVTVTGGTLKGAAGGPGGAGQDANGGGIDNGAVLTLSDVTVTGNTATSGRGGNNAAGVGGNGGQAVGGIYNYEQLTLTDSTVSSNVATSGGGGNSSGDSGGSSGHAVGGVQSNAGATTTVTNSTITGNQATSGTGGTSDTSGKVAGPGGSVVGGFEDNFAPLTMTGTTISHNSGTVGTGGAGTGGAQGGGSFNAVGGVAVNVPATISGDTISSNTATGGNAGSPTQTGGGIAGAGAYLGPPTGASQTITGTTITGNAGYGGLGTGGDLPGSVSGGGAIVIPAANAAVSFSNDTISANTLHSGPLGGTNDGGRATGGGLFINPATTANVSLSGVAITGNSAAGVGPYGQGDGGGIDVGGSVAKLTISASAITGNSAIGGSGSAGTAIGGAANGGGIWTQAALQLNGDTVAGNTAAGGSSSGSAFAGDASGGGLFSTTSQPVAIRNSTFTGNTASAGTPSTAQYSASAAGGGIYASSSGQLTLAADTLDGNGASAPSGFSAGGNLEVAQSAVLEDTIIAGGSSSSPDTTNCAGDLGIVDDGFNLESTAPSQCGLHASSDLIGVDPMLEPLASNGGPTQTMALGGASPALGAGGTCADPSNSNAPLKTDQRGEPRHVQCDIGAFEHQPPASTKFPTISGAPGVGETLTCNPAGAFSGDPPLRFTYQWLRGGKPISKATNAKYKVQSADNGQRLSCRVTASNAYGSATGTSKTVTGVAKPTLSKVSESHKRWREGSKTAKLAAGAKAPVGTSFHFTLNVSAAVALTFTSKHHKAAETLTFKSVRAGKRKVAFAGRLSKSKKLAPGSYTVKIVATNSAGQRSAAKTLSFTIVR